MPPRQSGTLTEAELRIMDVLWCKGSGTVQQVLDSITQKPTLAYNSVLTTIRVLERKGYVKHLKDGRAHVYTPLVGKKEATRSEIRHLVSRFFNSHEQLVLNLLEDQGIGPEDLARLRQMLDPSPNPKETDLEGAGQGTEEEKRNKSECREMIWLSVQTVAQVSAERILNALPEGLLVAFFAWALLRLLRRQNAGTRFAVWFLALLTIAALPLIGGFGEEQVRGLLSSVTTSATSWGSMRPAIIIPGHWGFLVFGAWAVGASVGLLRLGLGLWHDRQLRRSCTVIDPAGLDPALQQTMATISASRSVMVSTSENVRVPAAIGFWKRTIVLPAWALSEMPAEDLNVILLHEFAHLRRSDEWTNLIQKIVRALFFFHPAVWWIEKQLSVEREMACDDAVLAETANPRGYATCLVSLLEKSLAHRLADKHLANQRWSMVQAAINRAHEATLRLAQILDSNRPKATRVWKPALCMVATFSVVCLVALPQAPQFVAFDRGTLAGGADHQYFASSSRISSNLSSFESALPAASAIPAAFRTSESSAPAATAKVDSAPVRAHAFSNHQFAPIPRTAPLISEALPGQPIAISDGASFIETSANASAQDDQGTMPQFQTLVFVQATAYEINDAPVWRVQVWRVTLVNASFDRMARVPVVNKT